MVQRLDPSTHFRRRDLWSQQEARLAKVIDEGSKGSGYNRRYWQRIIRAPAKIDQIAARRKIPAFQAMQHKAMLTGRMIATYTDHMLKGTEVAYKKIGAEPLTPMQKQKLWDKIYDETIYRYRSDLKALPLKAIKELDTSKEYLMTGDQMAERDSISHLMRHIPDLITPPKKILVEREKAFQKHKGQMEKLIQTTMNLGPQEREQRLMNEVKHILTENTSEKQKAYKICLAASIFADSEKKDPMRKEKTWSYNYANAMFMVYDALKNETTEIIDAIQKLE